MSQVTGNNNRGHILGTTTADSTQAIRRIHFAKQYYGKISTEQKK